LSVGRPTFLYVITIIIVINDNDKQQQQQQEVPEGQRFLIHALLSKFL
jgi:hypothetical protein